MHDKQREEVNNMEKLPQAKLVDMSQKRVPLRLLSGKLLRYQSVRDGRDLAIEISSDGGNTWAQDALIDEPGYAQLRGRAIQIQEGPYQGRIILPMFVHMEGEHPDYSRKEYGSYATWMGERIQLETHTHVPEMGGSFVVFSDDDGKTWERSKGYLMGYFEDGHLGYWSCQEPVVAELKDNRLLCFMRSTTGRILKSYSKDGGESWSKVEATDIAMSNSPCDLKRIPTTGDLVLVWNPMTAEEICKGYRRGRISIAVSTDDGTTWEHCKLLNLSEGVEPVAWVNPGPLKAMVRGPIELGKIPDGFRHYGGLIEIYFAEDEIRIYYPKNIPGDRINIREIGLDPTRENRWLEHIHPTEWVYSD